MWDLFFLGLIVVTAFVYIPGFLFMSLSNKPLSQCIGYAPCITLSFYSGLAITYGELAIHSNWMIYFFPALALSLLGVFALNITSRKRSPYRSKFVFCTYRPTKSSLSLMGLCVFIGFLLMGYVFVKCLDGPSSYAQVYDNYYHLGMIKSFDITGDWSCLHPSLYTSQDGFSAPVPSTVYPTEYHMLGAMIMSCLPTDVPMAVNVLNTFYPAMILSSGMFCLVRQLFPSSSVMPIFGSFASFAFAMFPYVPLRSGPLFPLMASICMIPMIASALISFIESLSSKADITYFMVSVSGILALAACHPSSVFTLAVLLIPYCVQRLWRFERNGSRAGIWLRVLLISLFFLFVVCVWCFFYKAPFMQAALAVVKPKSQSITQSILSVITYSFGTVRMQPFVSITVLTGAIYLIVRKRNQWLIASALIASGLFVTAGALEAEAPLKHFLTGFWYTDRVRLAYTFVLFSVPICAYGLKAYRDLFLHCLRRVSHHARPAYQRLVSDIFVIVCFIVVVFTPILSPDNAISQMRQLLTETYTHQGAKNYDTEESSFASKANELIEASGTLGSIINIPHDGSLYAYSVDNSNIYFRQWTELSQPDPCILREQLNEIAFNDEVREAAQRANAKYVLQLDVGRYEEVDAFAAFYNPNFWSGITKIDENTPGFELILEEGDMRLFKIDDDLFVKQ